MRHVLRPLLALVLLALLAGCAAGPDTRKRDEALFLYAGAIRWGDIDGALTFVDPKLLAERPMTAVERARFDQVQIAGYLVKSSAPISEDELMQIVEIRVVNRHTQVERLIVDRQHWRWDDEADSWWLLSGLPDIGGR